MADSDKELDHLEQQIPKLAAAALTVAHWQALASGQQVLVSAGDGIYEVFADGTRRLVRRWAPPLSAPVGTRVRIP